MSTPPHSLSGELIAIGASASELISFRQALAASATETIAGHPDRDAAAHGAAVALAASKPMANLILAVRARISADAADAERIRNRECASAIGEALIAASYGCPTAVEAALKRAAAALPKEQAAE